MAVSAVAVVASAAGAAAADYVAGAAAFALLDAGIAVGSELVIGGVIGAVVGGAATLAISATASAVLTPAQNGASSIGSARAQGILINAASNVDPIPVIYGSRTVGGTRVFMDVSGSNNEFLNLGIALCEGPISAINTVYIDGVASTDARFAGLVTINKHLGDPSQVADSMLMAASPAKWTANHKLSGVAYLAVQIKFDGNVFRSLPTITADVDGKLVFDPQSGTMIFSSNPALCVRDYLTNTIYGRGLPSACINDASFIASAGYCDGLVSVPNSSGGTATQKRYACNGVIDVNATALDNLKALLTSCRGMLIFSGGFFKLLIDKPTVPSSFAFTEDNITGSWTISQPGKRGKFNRLTATFYNPAKNWQPDFAVYDSPSTRAQDNARLSESKIDLPFTDDYYRAMQIAQMELKQSRFGTVSKFSAFQEGLRCEVGDVVPVSHSTPGWTAKPFRVLAIEVKDSHEVYVTVREYDDSSYNPDTLDTARTVPATNLPDPTLVRAPGVPAVVESLYSTSGSVGVRSRATLTSAPGDAFVVSYQFEYQLQGNAAWSVMPLSPTPTIDIDDLAPGIYGFRVKSINALGKSSSYASTTKEIVGLSAPPSAVTSFSVTASNGIGYGAWNLSPDLDVRIGGRIVVRWTSLTSGATWENGSPVAEFNGDAVAGALPMLTGTYMAKAKDSSDNWSTTAAFWTLTAGNLVALPNSQILTEDPSFSGARSAVAVAGGRLALDGTTLIDSMATPVDSWPVVDSLGGVQTSGSYAFSAPMDFGLVGTRRFTANMLATAFDTGDSIDARGLVDNWDSVDGAAVNDATAVLQAALSNDGVSYGNWFPFMAGDFNCRAVKFRLLLSTAQPTHNVGVTQLSVTANW